MRSVVHTTTERNNVAQGSFYDLKWLAGLVHEKTGWGILEENLDALLTQMGYAGRAFHGSSDVRVKAVLKKLSTKQGRSDAVQLMRNREGAPEPVDTPVADEESKADEETWHDTAIAALDAVSKLQPEYPALEDQSVRQAPRKRTPRTKKTTAARKADEETPE